MAFSLKKYSWLVFVAFVLVSLLLLYTAYDKKTKQLEFGKLADVVLFKDAAFSLREFNKVIALAAIGVLAACFLLGPLTRIWPRAFCSYLSQRKAIGLAGFALAALHSAYSFAEYYKLDVGLAFSTAQKTYAFSAGLAALAIFFLMAITSTAKAVQKMGYAKWKALQTTGYLGLALSIAHFFIIETKPGIGFDVRPYGMLFFYAAVLALLLRLAIIFIRHEPKTKFEHHVGEEEEYCEVALKPVQQQGKRTRPPEQGQK